METLFKILDKLRIKPICKYYLMSGEVKDLKIKLPVEYFDYHAYRDSGSTGRHDVIRKQEEMKDLESTVEEKIFYVHRKETKDYEIEEIKCVGDYAVILCGYVESLGHLALPSKFEYKSIIFVDITQAGLDEKVEKIGKIPVYEKKNI